MPTAQRHHLLRRAATLVAVMALTAVGACGGGDDAPEDDARATTTVDPTTTTQLTPEEEAEAVYLEFVDTVNELLTHGPDPDAPALSALAVDPALGRLRDSLSTLQAENQIWRTGPRSSHQVLSTELTQPDTVMLRDCYVGNDTQVDQDDESIVSEGLSTEVLEVELKRIEGGWFVREVVAVEVFEGEVECQ